MPDVLELPSFDPPAPDRAGRVLAGLGLDGGLLVQAEQGGVRWRVEVGPADRLCLGLELRVRRPVEPVSDQVRLDVEVGQDPPDLGGGDAQRLP